MTDNALNISIPLKFEIKTHPRGMTDYDPKALSVDQQLELNSIKNDMRKQDILYLSNHPEIKAIVSMVIRKTKIAKPSNIVEYIAKIFTQPEKKIRDSVNKILRENKFEYEPIPFVEYDVWDY